MILSYKCIFGLLVAIIILLAILTIAPGGWPGSQIATRSASYEEYNKGIVLNRTELLSNESHSFHTGPSSDGAILALSHINTAPHIHTNPTPTPHSSLRNRTSHAFNNVFSAYRHDTSSSDSHTIVISKYHNITLPPISDYQRKEVDTVAKPVIIQPQKTKYITSFLKNGVPEVYPQAVFNESFLRLTAPGNSKSAYYPQHSLAQDMEDVWLYENLLYGMTGGTILESGAFDGLQFSTSHLFEHVLGYKSIHIEADPENFMYLKMHRPNSTNLNIALCGENRALHYSNLTVADTTRGFVEFMTPEFLHHWHGNLIKVVNGQRVDINEHNWTATPDPWSDRAFLDKYINIENFNALRVVQCAPFRSVLEELGVKNIDLWVLDTEGAEESILHSTDFNAVNINVIAMECLGSEHQKATDQRKMDYLQVRGFKCQVVLRNCMCKNNKFTKHEISNKTEDRSLLYPNRSIDKKRKETPYVIPATI